MLKAAVKGLTKRTRSWKNHRRLNELFARLDNVTDSRGPLLEPVALDRTNTAFHDIHRLAVLFLRGDWQQTATGQAPGFSLLLLMYDLFEKFVGKSLQKALGAKHVVLLQDRKYALRRARHLLRPDIVVDKHSRPVVLDTKWKRLGRDGPNTADETQMLVYGQAYGAERVILIYPWHEAVGAEGVHRRWTVTGAGYSFETATVNVGRPTEVRQTLRKLFV